MDVHHYFNPVDFSKYHNQGHLNWKQSLGAAIEKNSNIFSMEHLKKTDVAIIGAPFESGKDDNYSPETPNKIRAELYQLATYSSKINITDFGNLKQASSLRGNYQALRDIIDYFNELKITTVIIGGSQDLSVGVSETFRNDNFFTFTSIDSFLDVKNTKEPLNSTNYISRLLSQQPQLFQFNLIGYQNHYLASGSLNKIKCLGNHVRLGNLRGNTAIAEPALRNTDFLSFDMNSVMHAEAPGSLRVVPNGLRSEEACQLAKYAGLSNRLKVFGLFDVIPENDRNGLTMKLAAQIVWYFFEGFVNRINENPDSDKNNVKYQVEIDGIEKPIVFVRNTISNLWWMEFETHEKKKLYFACSEKDYELSSNNEIPGLWLNYIQKIDEVLK